VSKAVRSLVILFRNAECSHSGELVSCGGSRSILFASAFPIPSIEATWSNSERLHSSGKLFSHATDISISDKVMQSNAEDPLQAPLVQCICLLHIGFDDHPAFRRKMSIHTARDNRLLFKMQLKAVEIPRSRKTALCPRWTCTQSAGPCQQPNHPIYS